MFRQIRAKKIINIFKPIFLYGLNIIYLFVPILLGAKLLIDWLTGNGISGHGDELAVFYVCFSIPYFYSAIVVAQETKRSWLRFGCLYLSGQIYFVILLLFINTFTFGLTLTNLSFATIFIVILFSAIKFANYIETSPNNINEDRSIKSKMLLLTKKLFPFTLNFLYIAFFILVLTNELTNIKRDPININETLHLSIIGIFYLHLQYL